MSKLRTAVIGAGKVAHFHAHAYMKSPYSEFAGVYNHTPERAEAFAEQYHVKAYASIEAMAADGVQAVSVCTPHPNHRAAAVVAAKAGMHVLIEKPLASSLEDCDAIIKAVKEAGVTGATVCQRRFFEPCQRIRKAIDEGKIGKPILGQVNMFGWRSMEYYASDPWRGTWDGEGGGVLVNQAPHQLDLLLWYMGEIDELYGAWATLNHPDLEVDDTALALIRFKSGALGSIIVSNSVNPALYGKVHIFGENGAAVGVQTDGGQMFIAGMSSITEPPVLDLWTVPGEEGKLDEYVKEDSRKFFALNNSTEHYHLLAVNDFLSAVNDGREPLVTLEDGRRTVELFTAIYRSNRDRMPIRFPMKPASTQSCNGPVRVIL